MICYKCGCQLSKEDIIQGQNICVECEFNTKTEYY